MTRILAFIFDLDGTLVDTETIHAEAESKLLNDFGVKMTPKDAIECFLSTEINYLVIGDYLISKH